MADSLDDLLHELVNLIGDWLTLADQTNAQQHEPLDTIHRAIWSAYAGGYEASLRQAIKDISKVLSSSRDQ